MADLRDSLHRAAPTPPEFDEGALLRTIVRRSFRRRLTFAASAVALASAIAIGVAANDHSDRRTIIVSPSSTTPQTTESSIPAAADGLQWRALPAAPIAARSRAASVWTGSAFVVWGGRDGSYRALSDGAWYDPQARRWHLMRASPFGPAPQSGSSVGIRVGGEAVIVSGTKAAAYTPGSNTWRVLPDVPLATVDSSALVQPGAPSLVVLSGIDRGGRHVLAWLDPASGGDWHTAVMHDFATAVVLANGHVVYWPGSSGFDLDLATGTEHTIRSVPAALFHGYPFDPGTVAGSLVISPLAQLSWNAMTGAYKRFPGGDCGSATAWTGHALLTWGGSECQGDSRSDGGAEYDPSSGVLRVLPKFLSGRTGMASAWTGTELLIWGGQTDLNGHVVGDGASLNYTAPNPKQTVTTR